MNGLSNLLAPLAPLGTLFHVLFYEPVYNVLMLIYNFVHLLGIPGSFGLAIILLTLVLRGCLIPLTRKQLKSSREMQVLQPLLKELQAKYKNEPQKLMEEQRRLYKEHGVNPLSGCLPLVVQMPFLYALYGALYTVLPGGGGDGTLPHINGDIYPFLPHLSAVPDLHFIWLQGAANLGVPDPAHILPILAGILTFIQLRMAMPVRKKTPGQKDPTSQATGTMMYIMPFFTVFIGWRFAAGLALYWAISTGFSAAQQYFINRASSGTAVGGWGSLFLGIPGLEHLVPPPQDVAAQAVQRAATLNRVSGSGTAGAAALTAPPGGGFFGRVRDQVRALTEAQHSLTQQRHAERNGNAPADTPEADTEGETAAGPASNGSNGSNGASATPSQRQRPRARSAGPVLIKPPTSNAAGTSSTSGDAVDQAIHAGTDQRLTPEQEIARAATGRAATGPAPLGANDTNGTNGANGTNGKNGANGKPSANGTNGTNGTSGVTRAPAAKGNYTNSNNSNKRANSGRRDTRAKGGR